MGIIANQMLADAIARFVEKRKASKASKDGKDSEASTDSKDSKDR